MVFQYNFLVFYLFYFFFKKGLSSSKKYFTLTHTLKLIKNIQHSILLVLPSPVTLLISLPASLSFSLLCNSNNGHIFTCFLPVTSSNYTVSSAVAAVQSHFYPLEPSTFTTNISSTTSHFHYFLRLRFTLFSPSFFHFVL